MWTDASTIMPKKIESAKWLYLSNPRIFKGELIQVLLRKKFESMKQLYRFKPPEAIQLLLLLLLFEATVFLQNLWYYYKAVMYAPITVRDSGVYERRVSVREQQDSQI